MSSSIQCQYSGVKPIRCFDNHALWWAEATVHGVAQLRYSLLPQAQMWPPGLIIFGSIVLVMGSIGSHTRTHQGQQPNLGLEAGGGENGQPALDYKS